MILSVPRVGLPLLLAVAGLAPKAHAAGVVKSVEYVEIAMGGGVGTNFATLTKGQVLANCVPFATMKSTGTTSLNNMFTNVALQAGPSRVVVTRTGTSQTVTVGVHVVEFDPLRVRVQQGTFTAGTPVNLATAVDLAHAAVVGYAQTAATNYDSAAVRASFASSSQVQFTRTVASGATTGSFYVFEAVNLSGTFAFSVQTRSISFTGTSASSSALAPSVEADKSFVIASHQSSAGGSSAASDSAHLFLANCSGTPSLCTRVDAARYNSGSQMDITAFILSFPDGVRVQRGTLSYAATVFTSSATLTMPVDPSKTMAWNPLATGPGMIRADSGSANQCAGAHQLVKLTSPTNVSASRAFGDDIGSGSYEAVEWGPSGPGMRIKSGSYVGNGVDNRPVFVGFQPDVVIVDRHDPGYPGARDEAVLRTSTMVGDASKMMDDNSGGQALAADLVQSLDATGFTVGTHDTVNRNGITYYWVAFKASLGELKVGSYTGANSAQAITGVGFTPAYLLVAGADANRNVVAKSVLMPTTFSQDFIAQGFTNAILGMQPDGFQLGTDNIVNQNNRPYHYVAWASTPGRIAVGSYTGNNSDNRSISGTGFWPEYVVLSRSSDLSGSQGSAPVHKTASSGVGADWAPLFDAPIAEANNIQKLLQDGFELGNHVRVNGNTAPTTYYWAAFGPFTPPGRYRSVGTNGANLNTGARTVQIVGNTATFSGPMPNNIGVGDMLQYQVGPFQLAVIEGRVSSNVYTVASTSGGSPVAAPALTAVSVFRAYTSLSNWQAQAENGSIDVSVRDFDTSRDLVAAGVDMQVACYNDGPMNDMVGISGWTTSPTAYIRIFTPVEPSHVGVSQRHTGVAGTGFRLTPVGAGLSYQVINLLDNVSYVRIEGLEIDGSGLANALYVRGIRLYDGMSNVGDVRIDSMLIHDLHTTQSGVSSEGSMGIIDFQSADLRGPPMLITNNIIYDITNNQQTGHIAGIHIGSRATSYVLNNTIYAINNFTGCAGDCGPSWGIYNKAFGGGAVGVVVQNNYVGNVTGKNGPNIWCYDTESGGALIQSYNVSSDATASGTGSQTLRAAYASYFVNVTPGSENLHLVGPSSSPAIWNAPGIDLFSTFTRDIDQQVRTTAWDIGADEFDGTTAVTLQSFEARPADRAVELAWRTGSELSNLGFHLYRATTPDGPWTRLTSTLIPGLGSSALGQAYAWRDAGLTNGVRYYYRLEDVDASSTATSHGPVSAVPQSGARGSVDDAGAGGSGDARKGGKASASCPGWVLSEYASIGGEASSASVRCTRHGNPEATALEQRSGDSRAVVLELRTGGFYALHEPDGTARVFVPGFELPADAGAAALPVRRALVDAVVGRQVRLAGVRALEVARFSGLEPGAVGRAEMEVGSDGTVRPGRGRTRVARLRAGSTRYGSTRGGWARGGVPAASLATLLPSLFQGEKKSAVVQLAPLRYDTGGRQLLLATRLRVRLEFAGREPGEVGLGNRGRARPKPDPEPVAGELLARLYATRPGLHAVSFEQLPSGSARGFAASELRLELQGRPVAFHVEPDPSRFAPGSRLYFHVDHGASSTDFSEEVAYELVRGAGGTSMAVVAAAPGRVALADASWVTRTFETDRFYQPGLLDAPDPWLWEALPSGATRVREFALAGIVEAGDGRRAEVEVQLQGASESGLEVDHHVSLSLNGTLLGEARFAGKLPYLVSLEVPAGVLREGPNQLSITNVGDTGVSSLVFLDRFTVSHAQAGALAGGLFEGTWFASGAATLAGAASGAAVVDATDPGGARWLAAVQAVGGGVSFQAEAGRRYLAVSPEALAVPRVAAPSASSLRATSNQADWILIAPRAFLPAAEPLSRRRADQGLAARAVAFEEIADEFGHGRPSAEAIRDFLTYAYQSWARPSVRYVLLLGDASYDPRNFAGNSQPSPLPALWTKTSYLVTASDPLLAAVNGEDPLPDLAIGRLPAASVEQAQALVAKLVAWEESGQGLAGPAALVADNPDLAGDFESDVRDVASSFLADRSTRLLLLTELGSATRPSIQTALDDGLSYLGYVGHGGGAVWASENVWNSWDAASLAPQSQQPLLLTWNCLNGYFVAPSYDSLAESLLKAEGRGAVAAFSPSGLSLDGPAHVYHRALMAELTGGRHARLGDAITAAQQVFAASGLMPELLSVYHLLGDPATSIR